MSRTRRQFLCDAAVGFTAAALPLFGARRAFADDDAPVVVVVFQRGAADALTLAAPVGDPGYTPALRPSLRVGAGALDLDGFFAFPPQLAELHTAYLEGELAVVHLAGSPHGTRSHFEAQDYMERGVPGDRGTTDGWLNRYLGALASAGDPLMPQAGVTLGALKAAALAGPAPSINFRSIASYRAPLTDMPGWSATVGGLYADSLHDPALRQSLGEMVSSLAEIAQVPTATSVAYPDEPTALALRDAAALIRANIGVRAIAVSSDGWDSHAGQNALLSQRLPALSRALAAFRADLGAASARTLTLVVTEFGRTVAENGSGGTDHGHGGVMLALGQGVSGGRVLLRNGVWPGLDPAALHAGRDLQVTTDFRDVYAEILTRHCGVSDLSEILPGYAVDPARFPGLIA